MIRGLPLRDVAEAGLRYGVLRARRARRVLPTLLDEPPGRGEITDAEHATAGRVAAGLAKVGARCLAQSVVVAQMLRARGVAARVVLSVDPADPRRAHAHLVVGDRSLLPHDDTWVVFR